MRKSLFHHTRVVPILRIDTHREAMTSSSSSSALLPEESHVRIGENVLVASLTFAFFWATFGLAWLASTKYVPEFRAFPAPQKADWCSRCVCLLFVSKESSLVCDKLSLFTGVH